MSLVTTNRVPRLQPGDVLTRDEFERRYHAMPRGTRAELIEGEVHMPSPVRFEEHGNPHADVSWWLSHYQLFTPGVRASVGPSIRLDLENEPEPDALLCIEPGLGGQLSLANDGILEGAPELAAEISASTVSIDRNKKFRVYQRNGVREYLLFLVEEKTIEWYHLDGQYRLLPADGQGIIRSRVFPGLWLDAGALVCANLPRLLEVLQQGLSTPEHAAFVTDLSARKNSPRR